MRVKKILFFIMWGWTNAAFGIHLTDSNDRDHYDIVVYGASPAGVTAAVQSARMGKSVALLTPDAHLGGIVVEGLGGTDIDNHASFRNSPAVGGMALEFYKRVAAKYGQLEALETAIREGTKQLQLWRYEPHVAEEVMEQWVNEYDIAVFRNARLREGKHAVKKENGWIRSIRMEDGRVFFANVFIDATVEGDILASAGITTVVGRESNAQYSELRNGITMPTANDRFKVFVDPYWIEGNPQSGLLPLIQPGAVGTVGQQDASIQGYCFRVCMTADTANQLPITKPATYNRADYTLFLRYLRAGGRLQVPRSNIPNGKTDFNGGGDLSHNFFGINHAYPNGSYAERAAIRQRHRDLTQGLLYFYQNDPEVGRIDPAFQQEWKRWGLAKDEFIDNAGWPRDFYVRDARRMVSDYVISERHIKRDDYTPVEDPVAVAFWPPDVHAVRRIVVNDTLYNEGTIFGGHWWRPFGISYRSLVPKPNECKNLLTPTCPSSSHIAYGAIRLEWTFMALGQAVGTAAALAVDSKRSVQLVTYETLAAQLERDYAIVRLETAQEKEDTDKIAASQRGSSPLQFTVSNDGTAVVVPGTFHHEQECSVRGGIPNFLDKAEKGDPLTVAFIGGSITQSNTGYRPQTARYFQGLFPKVDFKWINAGVSGTGTDLGAFRIQEQVLRHNPDLIFIEFAVNGAYQPGMEGMIRQIIKANPKTDICLIYTIHNGQTAVYQQDKIPDNIRGLEQVAAHYQLPSIHLGMEAASLEAQEQLVWKGDEQLAKDKLLFSTDGIHPKEAGGNLYAAAIARGLAKMQLKNNAQLRVLPPPLYTDGWEHATMYEPQNIATFDENWERLSTAGSHLKQFNGWFNTVMTANKAGASCTFYFEGDMFGVFDVGGPEVGQLSVWIDDRPVGVAQREELGLRFLQVVPASDDTLINRFNQYCNNRYRGQYDLVRLEPGRHKITLKIASAKANKKDILGLRQLADITDHPKKYDDTRVYLGRILLRGKP